MTILALEEFLTAMIMMIMIILSALHERIYHQNEDSFFLLLPTYHNLAHLESCNNLSYCLPSCTLFLSYNSQSIELLKHLFILFVFLLFFSQLDYLFSSLFSSSYLHVHSTLHHIISTIYTIIFYTTFKAYTADIPSDFTKTWYTILDK